MRAASTSSFGGDGRRIAPALALWLLAAGCYAPPPHTPPPGKSLRGIPSARLMPGTPWTGWDDAAESLVTFEFTRGWTVECEEDPTATLNRASDRATDGRYAARVSAAGAERIGRVLLKPPAPIPIPEPFDSVELRLSIGADADPEAAGIRPFVRVRVETAEGDSLLVHLGRFPAGGWRLAHRRLAVDPPIAGARLTGIEIIGWDQPAAHPLYVAGLAFYLESRAPIVPAWRRGDGDHRPMAAVAQGDAVRPREDSAGLPPSPEIGCESRLDPDRALAEFTYMETGVRITYALRFDDGCGRVQVLCDDAPAGEFEPIGWEPEGERPRKDRARIARRDEDGAVEIEFDSGCRVRARLAGRALVLDVAADRRDIPYLVCPRWRSERAVAVPLAFLNAPGWSGPAVTVFRAPGGEARAACAYLDPRISRATRWEMPPREEDAAAAPMRALYEPPAFGRRNPVRERVVLTVAARLEDVLPGVGRRAPNAPPIVGLPPDAHETILDSDEISPLSSAWSRDFLRRDADGQWIAAGEKAYAVKWPLIELLRRPEMEAVRAGVAGPESVLVAALTARAPWAGVDYDPRTLGAASFNAARFGLARSLRDLARAVGRPVIGHDDWIWFWADALDGWRVAPDRVRRLLSEPVPPLFGLARLRPLGEGLLPAPRSAAPLEEWDRWSAALLWYGLAPGAGAGAMSPGAARARRMTEPLLRRTRGRAPERIAFASRGRLTDAAEVLAAGARADGGRMYLRYAPDLEIWIRRDEDGGDWRISVGGEDWRLPPQGWIARGEGLLAFSGWNDGRRADYLEQGAAVYLDPRGAAQRLRDVGSDAPVRARRERSARGWVWEAEPDAGATFVEFRLSRPDAPGTAAAVAFGSEGAPLGPAPAEIHNGWLRAAVPAGAVRLRIEWIPSSGLE